MIVWKLRKVMDEKRVKGKDLADRIGKHPNTVYRLRDSEEMPAVNGHLLNDLCNSLDCTLSDLIEFIPDKKQTTEVSISSSEPPPTDVATAVAIGATQAIGSKDVSLAAKVAASVMKVLLECEDNLAQK